MPTIWIHFEQLLSKICSFSFIILGLVEGTDRPTLRSNSRCFKLVNALIKPEKIMHIETCFYNSHQKVLLIIQCVMSTYCQYFIKKPGLVFFQWRHISIKLSQACQLLTRYFTKTNKKQFSIIRKSTEFCENIL